MTDDLTEFTEISQLVAERYESGGDDPWLASPFGWIKRQSSRRVGTIGELMVEAWLQRRGCTVLPPSDSGHDRTVDGIPVEVKFSTLWAQGTFVFQQLRDQSYELVALLGLEPGRVHLWFVPKWLAWQEATPQHAGAQGTDTRWLRFPAASPPGWLDAYGGTLDAAFAALEEARRQR